jgi:hypothetical protein
MDLVVVEHVKFLLGTMYSLDYSGYNSLSIAIFHFSWKMQSDVWGTVNASGISHITGGNFAQSANTINGWLRDFLWAQSSQVIQSYGSVSVWFNFPRRSLYLGIQSYVLI